MARILIFIFFVFFINSCNKKSATQSLQIIRYNSDFKDYFSDGTIENSTTNLIIAYYKTYILYGVPSTSFILKKSSLNRDTIFNELIPSNDTTYTYFVLEENAKIGRRYDSLSSSNGSNFKPDSLFELINIDSANLKIFSVDLGKPYKITKEKDKILEVFLNHTVNGTDTIYRYFDKGLSDLQFSFSQLSDTQKKSKLYKTRMVQFSPNTNYKPTQSFVIRTDITDEIKRLKIDNQTPIIKLFEKFEHESEKLNLK